MPTTRKKSTSPTAKKNQLAHQPRSLYPCTKAKPTKCQRKLLPEDREADRNRNHQSSPRSWARASAILCAAFVHLFVFMIMDSADANATISGPSERRIHNNRTDSYSESSECQEEKKESSSCCDESKTRHSILQHEKLRCNEEIVTDVAPRHSRRDSAATVSSGSSSSSGSAPPRTPQHETILLRTPDHLDMPKNELLGLSLFTNNREHVPFHPTATPGNSSDDALERYASRIRQELRHKEMMELAEAAERAAEAGEESFAIRPSTFGSSEWRTMDDSILAPNYPTISTVTRPHRLTPLLIRKRIEKIGVTELRDVHEVFPDFGEFHTHLRTHLVRGGVDRKMTVFKEKPNKNSGDRIPLSNSCGKGKGLNFLRDLNDWISPSHESTLHQEYPNNNCALAWDIGSIISEHINMSSSKSPTSKLYPETRSSEQQSKEYYNERNHNESDAQLTALLSKKHGALKSKRTTVRRSLFDDDDFPPSQSETQASYNAHRADPVDEYSTTRDAVKHRADFVTPVRLRDMRRHSDTDDLFDRFMSSSSLLDSPLNDEKERKQRVGVDMAIHDSSASNSSITVPRLLSIHSSSTTKPDKKERHANDDRIRECETLEDSRDEGGEGMPINGFPIIGSFLLDGVAPDLSRTNFKLDQKEADDPNHDAPFNTQLARLNNQPNYTSSIRTPLRDECGCLSIPTNSSLQSNEASSLNPDRQLPQLVTAQEDRNSFSGRNNPLADLISRMSPNRKGFHSMMAEKRLYFRPKENDAFLNNYLYCGKPMERCHNENNTNHRHSFLCAGPDVPTTTCVEWNVDSCCTAILPDTFSDHRQPPPTAATQQSFVSLGGTPSIKSEAEIWFDRATEGFDHFLEQWSGVPSTSAFRRWTTPNVSFQAPSLNKKIVPVPHAGDIPPTKMAVPAIMSADSATEIDFDDSHH